MKSQNVTLTLPEELLCELKRIAAQRDSNVSALLTDVLRQIVERESSYESARDAMEEDLRGGYSLGTFGQISWTRDSLHERREARSE